MGNPTKGIALRGNKLLASRIFLWQRRALDSARKRDAVGVSAEGVWLPHSVFWMCESRDATISSDADSFVT